MPSAAVVIIGDEILSGKFADENGPYFIRRFRDLGVDLLRIATIGDGVDGIANEVRRCSVQADHVFTTGGVGPTHDDRTFEGVAAAFGVDMVLDDVLLTMCIDRGLRDDPATRRMVTVPLGTEHISSSVMSFPVLKVRNVWVLPGVPQLVKQKFETIAPSIAGEIVQCVRIYAHDRETEVAALLDALDRAHPEVAIGSYPRWGEPSHKLIVTLEGRDLPALIAARDALLPQLDVVRTEGP